MGTSLMNSLKNGDFRLHGIDVFHSLYGLLICFIPKYPTNKGDSDTPYKHNPFFMRVVDQPHSEASYRHLDTCYRYVPFFNTCYWQVSFPDILKTSAIPISVTDRSNSLDVLLARLIPRYLTGKCHPFRGMPGKVSLAAFHCTLP